MTYMLRDTLQESGLPGRRKLLGAAEELLVVSPRISQEQQASPQVMCFLG